MSENHQSRSLAEWAERFSFYDEVAELLGICAELLSDLKQEDDPA